MRRPTTSLELDAPDRERIFNLGYYTWVEQQGIPLEVFEAPASPGVLERARASTSASGTS